MSNSIRKQLLKAGMLAKAAVRGRYVLRYLRNRKVVRLQPAEDKITIVSCNVRYLTPQDQGKKSWFYRANLLLSDIAAQQPGIIGFQEVTCWQYDYLVATLKGYDAVLEYRDDAPLSEGCPIFYNEALYVQKDKGSFWLSETPEVMSKDWGSQCYRICSYVILTEKATDRSLVVFNTHLDHGSEEARIKGIAVVLDKIAQFGYLPCVIMGDFNALEGSQTYLSATEHFLDAQYTAADTMEGHTFHCWGHPEHSQRLDYFMVSKTGFYVQRYWVAQSAHDGVYARDHYTIGLQLILQ